MTTYVKEIVLPWPSPDLTPHAKGSKWPKIRATKEARALARLVAMGKPAVQTIPDAVIFVEYWPKARRGDVHNQHGRMKPYIDGIADAMGCDDRKFKVDFPSVWAGTDHKGKVIFRVMYPFQAVPVTGVIS